MSIFTSIDKELNSRDSFWKHLELSNLVDIKENKLYSSLINFLGHNNVWKKRTVILTKTSIYYCKKDESPKKKSMIVWKKTEAFTETIENQESFGFRIIRDNIFQDFYLENSEILDNWLKNLSKVTIMDDLEEDYVIIKEIGKGNYATVYLAYDLHDNSQCAVKSISKEIIGKSSRGVFSIIYEIEIMRKVDHPVIIKLYKVYESEEYIHLVIEYLRGGSLYQRIRDKISFPEAVAAKFITNLLIGLEYLHANNIAHRDIKLENILMCSYEDDTLFKLADFGLGYISEDYQNNCCGSPGYIAPEILHRMPYNHKVDVFSAGIILYIILSGKTPFYSKNKEKILYKNQVCNIYFNEKDWGKVSKDCIDLLLRLTDKNPENRITAEEALEHRWLKTYNPMKNSNLLVPTVKSTGIRNKNQVFSVSLMERSISNNKSEDNTLRKEMNELKPLFSKNANKIMKNLRNEV